MDAPLPSTIQRRTLPLYVQVLIGVALGTMLGIIFKTKPILFGLKNDHLGQLGMLVIKLLRAMAIPLILFSILDSFVKTGITIRHGGKLIVICVINVSIAMAIGLTIMNTLKPGLRWHGKLDQMVASMPERPSADAMIRDSHKGTLSPMENIASYVPRSMVDPFSENNVITVVSIAVLAGAALRRVRSQEGGALSIRAAEEVIDAGYRVLVQMLEWIVLTIPFAVFGVVAKVVGEQGLQVFSFLWIFLATILLGMIIHALGYYPLVAWLVGGKSPRRYLGIGADAIVTGLSCNSSLATVPITLKCLDRMGVSPQSARLSACIGTNLNNDGITLYEAMAALFVLQAVGASPTLSAQLAIVLASIMAGAGIAGIPEAGLVMLPLVLQAAGLSDAVIAVVLPLIMTVDWIIARCRSAVNVMADMLVAILLDAGTGR
jgi:Na+/H+-dicarboxylate symporter